MLNNIQYTVEQMWCYYKLEGHGMEIFGAAYTLAIFALFAWVLI